MTDMDARWAALTAQFPRSIASTDTGSDEVLSGQLREAVWGEREATVLVVGVNDTRAEVTVYPVSLEPGVADDRAIVFQGDTVPIRGGLSVWPEAEATLSFVVLDTLIAQLPTDAMRWLRTRSETHVATSSESPRFEAIPLPGSGAAIAIDELLDSVESLATIRPEIDRQPVEQRSDQFPLGLRELMSAARISQPTAMSVMRGKAVLTPSQAKSVAVAAGIAVSDLLAFVEPLPADLKRELMEPRWRDVIRRRAGGGGEAEAREELGRGAFALAARAKGDGRALWRQRIQAVLATEAK